MIYLYSNVACDDCAKQATALNKLREVYPGLRVYTFDYDIDLSAVETLKKIFKLKAEFPIVIINEKVYYGLQDFDKLESYLPASFKQEEINNASSTATTSTIKAKKS
jgi:glutaredoxin